MELSQQEFDSLRSYIYTLCGVVIPEDKTYLIQQRLEPVVLANDCKSFGEFYQKLKQSPPPKIDEDIINAITTGETSFFRDGHPFIAIKEYILPRLGELIRKRKAREKPRTGPKVSVWSAGSSTGQEPYSLAMLIHEYATANRHLSILKEDFGLLATDISSAALSKAMSGEYTEMETKRGLSPDRMVKYFVKDGNQWVLNGWIRIMVEFRQVNLIRPFTMLGSFDVILCRNVLIYFDNMTKTRTLDQFYDMLSEGGFLLLGSTENLYAISDKYESLHHGDTLIYRKPTKD